ncbi:AMP-binding protein [Pseudoalteromonas byunsanensis]|uniref:Uncharacterized protein n=1 Tax=Pseudoalteromonas byunsanensis TaxID=327939 RepID=A0A1S1N906_9GAMM|nr:AMP-binding protein [Pseudoalteromonas byunsanensis]OHU95998.1 hypothetical protein BIW53_09355 [Pseudoalteromonas byunsanensis]
MSTIIDYLEKFSKTKPTVEWYFPDMDKTVNLAELKKIIGEYTSRFEQLELREQSIVGVALPNGLELVACLYACWQRNIVAVPLRTKSGKYHSYSNFIKGCHISCKFSMLVCADSFGSEDINEWKSLLGIPVLSISELNAIEPKPEVNICPPRLTDMAIIQFSSGSTGFPKGVVVTHGMAVNQLQHIFDHHGNNSVCETTASWTPINHDMGLFTGVLYPVFSGCNNVLASPDFYMRNPPRWFKLLSKYSVDITFTTNSALAVAMRSIKRLYNQEDVDLRKLHVYISAEKVSSITLTKARKALAPIGLSEERIHTAYGMAENSLGASVSKMGALKINSVVIDESGQVSFVEQGHPDSISLVSSGYPNARHIITVRDKDDNCLAPMQMGEFNIESDCLTSGYINQPDITEEKLANGRFRTGDLGFLSDDGELYFYSRKDDLVVYNGRNIVPEDIEETVESLDFVRASASVLLAIEHEKTGVMGLHVVVETAVIDSADEIFEKQMLISNAIAQTHDVVVAKVYLCAKGTIEKTSSGKKRRKVILSRLKEGLLDVYEGDSQLIA